MQLKNSIKMMKISLDVIEKKLSPLLKVLGPVNSKLELVAANLDKVKHNLVVQVLELSFLLSSSGPGPGPGPIIYSELKKWTRAYAIIQLHHPPTLDSFSSHSEQLFLKFIQYLIESLLCGWTLK